MTSVHPCELMFRIAYLNTYNRQEAYYMPGFPVERIISIAANP
jgi:hypothetical protein